jgi:hypothetical protein
VMYETTNNIDVYIKDKPICGTWNNGNTLIGIQNIDGTEGIAAPGRNTSDSPWEAYNEAWRFSFFEGETVEAYNTTFSVCDTGNGGFESFDFSLIEGDVAGNQSNVTVSFHETFLDANNNINPIASPYVNILNPQTVYARVENSDGLFATSEVTLEVIDCIDNDNDGVSTEQEDLNGDGYPGNDDTDNDGIPNYLDEDDDNDNVDTIDEITGIGAGFNGVTYIFIDTDSDGIENYIDNDDDGDGVLSVFEDYNGNGTPIDDDTNANNIPDFLDDEVAIILVIESNSTVDFSISPNPASEMIQIQLSNFSSETQVILYNIQGQVVLSEIKNSENGNFAINVSDLALGMYFVQLQSEDKTVSKKLIKN